jgi:hypothetical protein
MPPSAFTPLRARLMWPWMFKVFYGILMDCIPIFGSTKKSYIILMALVQCIVLCLMAFGPEFTLNETYYAWMCTLYSIASCFTEAACQGLMVIESKQNPSFGGEDLQSIAWLIYSVGGLFCVYLESSVDPKNKGCFLIAAASAGLLAISSILISSKIEINQAERARMSAGTRIRVVFAGLCYGMRIKEIWKAFIFQLIFGIAPTFLIYVDEYILFFADQTLADYWKI